MKRNTENMVISDDNFETSHNWVNMQNMFKPCTTQ